MVSERPVLSDKLGFPRTPVWALAIISCLPCKMCIGHAFVVPTRVLPRALAACSLKYCSAQCCIGWLHCHVISTIATMRLQLDNLCLNSGPGHTQAHIRILYIVKFMIACMCIPYITKAALRHGRHGYYPVVL